MLRVLRHSPGGSSKPDLVTDSNYKVIGINIRHGMNTTYYHRTARSIGDLCDTKKGDLRTFFAGTEKLKLFTKSQSILDIGCGAGNLAKGLQNASILAVGLDYYLDEDQSKSEYLVQGDAYRLPFIRDSFSCLFSTWSAFHFEPVSSLSQLLGEASRVLAPYGALYLSPMHELERIEQIKTVCRRLNLKFVLCFQTGAMRIEKN